MNAKTILASLHAVLLALLLSSCHEPVPAGGSGAEILFTGRTYPEVTTKTSYSGDINNANLERINWEPGDDLTLVSPTARVYTNTSVQPWVLGHNQGSGTWSKVSYQLQNGTIQTDPTDVGRSLMRMVPKEATGLQWEDPGTYYIYGVYPSESSSDASRPTISWSGPGAGQGNISATIPSSQGYASSAKDDLASPTPTGIKHITRIEPDMSKAYMYAGLKKDIVAGDKIEAALDFYPMFTAFEFGVKALPDPVTGNSVKIDIDWFELVSESCALSGEFTSVVTVGNTCNLPSGSKAFYTTPAYAAANGKVRLEMPRQEGTSNTAVTVSSEDSLVFTVFVLPKGQAYNTANLGAPSLGDLPGESTITDLTVRFRIKKQGTNQQWTGRSLALKPKVKTNLNPGITLSANDFVEFPAGKKVRINGLQLPSQQDPWSFSVSATDLEEEISDVAVNPVQVQSWESVDPDDALDTVFGTIAGGEVPYSGGSVTLSPSFENHRVSGSRRTPLAWKLQYSEDGGTTWSDTPPSWASVDRSSSSSGTDGNGIVMTVAPQVNSKPDVHRTALLGNGSASGADLSLLNVATGEAVSSSTANCYVVQKPGTYKFPLVYGNGLKNGAANESAYRAKAGAGGDYRPDDGTPGTDATRYLGRFVDHSGAYITSPWITDKYAKGRMDAVLLWTDVPGLVADVAISSTENYLTFSVPSEYITQGNALVAVRVDGKIAWSWHIWVTDNAQTATGVAVNGCTFAPENIGWCDGREEAYAERSLQVRVYQLSKNEAGTPVTVRQTPATFTYGGNNPYFQWGRKDPLQASSGKETLSMSADATYYKRYYPSSDAYAPQNGIVGKVPLQTAVANPFKEYVMSPEDNWCSTTFHNLWNAQLATTGPDARAVPVVKTVYDPSPMGYCVPSYAAFSGFTTANLVWNAESGTTPAGCTYQGTTLFLPAAGYHDNESDKIGGVQTAVWYWSSTPTGGGDDRGADLFQYGNIEIPARPMSFATSVRPVVEGGSASGTSAGTSSYVLGGNPF